MKIVAINGSPRKNGNCATALSLMGEVFKSNGIDFEIIHVGHKPIHGCMACGKCKENKNEKCIIEDIVNDTVPKMKEADGIIISSPVYYAGIAGTMKCFLDRAYYVAGSNGGLFNNKVAASVVAVRRSGGSSTLDTLNHYHTITESILASSTYWSIVHGRGEAEMTSDDEAVQTVERLAENMIYILNMKAASSITPPAPIEKIFTNFVR